MSELCSEMIRVTDSLLVFYATRALKDCMLIGMLEHTPRAGICALVYKRYSNSDTPALALHRSRLNINMTLQVSL